MSKQNIYLDYMASTPLDPRVLKAMREVETIEHTYYANPSATHEAAYEVQQLIDKAKIQIAESIRCKPNEIIFTSGATESNNLALFGLAKQYAHSGNHIITIANEHKAVLEPCKELEKQGFVVTYLKPNKLGKVDCDELEKAITDKTIIVSTMWVNNETGMINPMQDIARIVKTKGVLLHCDAAQAIGKVSVNFAESGIDCLSLAAHKCYGPKGIGALIVRSKPRVRLQPMFYGGGQQFGLRPGTLPTQLIVGMGKACEIAAADLLRDQQHTQLLRDHLWHALQSLEGVSLNGDFEHRVTSNLNISFTGVNPEALLFAMKPLIVSTGSACNATSVIPSHVLTAMDIDEEQAAASIRISLGRFTTHAEIDQAGEIIINAVMKLRALAPREKN